MSKLDQKILCQKLVPIILAIIMKSTPTTRNEALKENNR